MPELFEGVDLLIDKALRVTDIGKGSDRRYATKTCALRLTAKPYAFDAAELCRAILLRIERNWRNSQGDTVRLPSRENWRLEKQLYIADNNRSCEKILEKAIVSELGEEWVNQVPTASGLLNSTANKHCNIDLVHIITPNEYELIELKVPSSDTPDTPIYAAFELLKYAMAYTFSRKFAAVLDYTIEEKPLLFATWIHLIVLAPYQFYGNYQLRWLERELNRSFATGSLGDIPAMDFRFEYFRVVDGVIDSADIVPSRKRLYSA
jgi:hypothetical protein